MPVVVNESGRGECLGLGEKFAEFTILAAQPFTQRNLDRFGATWLLKHAKKVHLVDASSVVWGDTAVETDESDAVDGVLRPKTWEELEPLFQKSQGSLLIQYLAPYMVEPLFELASRYSISICCFDMGRIPATRSFAKRIVSGVKRLVSDPKSLLQRAQGLDAPATAIDFLVLSGRDCDLKPTPWRKMARTVVPSHSYDYVIWKEAAPFVHPEPYIVFLDQAKENHPHWKTLYGYNPFERRGYYSQIETLLRRLSDTYGMPVLVALHPRSPDKDPRPYNGFQTFQDRTPSLVKGASLVVVQDSTAVSFAVLGRKPVVFVEMPEQRTVWQKGNVTRDMSDLLGSPVVRPGSRRLPSPGHLQVDESKYSAYEAMYIRHPSCTGTPVWDRVFGVSAPRI
jgi:hypothetical protein